MTEELCRAKFEEWYLSHWQESWSFAKNKTIADIEHLRGQDGDYSEYPYTNGCWTGWQAAWNTRAEMEKSDA